jgi:hypothetical protein
MEDYIMNSDIWNLWPWFSLAIFALLVKITLPVGGVYLGYPFVPSCEAGERGGDRIGLLLVISLIVGAAICVLITNALAS